MKKNPGGQPMKFKTVEELQEKIDAYFATCIEDGREDRFKRDKQGNLVRDENGKKVMEPYRVKRIIRPPTVSGLAVFLGTTRQTLLDYQNVYDKYSDTVKNAKEFIQSTVVEGLMSGKYNSAGCIFNLKNNRDRKDKTEVTNTIKTEISEDDLVDDY